MKLSLGFGIVAIFAIGAVGCGSSGPLVPGDGSADGTVDAGDGDVDGAADAGGSDGAADAVQLPINAGCGKELPVTQPLAVPGTNKGYLQYTVMGTGATLDGTIPSKAGPRTFWVRVPADYDPNHKYRTVYIGQGCGGYEVANTQTLQLFNGKVGGEEEAIYVALDIPTDMANQDCYDNRAGLQSQEWEAFELFHSVVDANYCVDNDNVFVSGYSTGGWLTNMWGCYFAGDGQHPWNGQVGGSADAAPRKFAPRYHIRGQAAVSGGEPDNNPPCNGPIAAIWIHDLMDNNAYSQNHDVALPRVLRMNGCEGSRTAPWHEDVAGAGICVQYTDCPARYPVVFCTTTGQGRTDQHYRAVPAFKLFFDEASDGGASDAHPADGGAE